MKTKCHLKGNGVSLPHREKSTRRQGDARYLEKHAALTKLICIRDVHVLTFCE